jgi:hypothetical protein
MSKIFNLLVLHPGLRVQYFKSNKWPQQWQDEAVQITCHIFEEDYKDFIMADDGPTSSMNMAHTQGQQGNEVSEIIFFNCLLTSNIEKYLLFGNACSNGRFSGQ